MNFPFSQQTQRFQACGTITYSSAGKGNQYRQARNFTVARDGSTWKIRTTIAQESASDALPLLYSEAGCDGTHIFSLEQYDPNSPSLRDDPNTRKSNFSPATGRVSKTAIPAALESDLVYPLWLAYCSGSHLQNAERLVAPFSPINHGSAYFEDPKGHDLPIRSILMEGGFPKQIEWYSEGKSMEVDSSDKVSFLAYPPPYDKGFLHAVFETLDSTPFENYVLPSRFKVSVLVPDFSVNSGNGKLNPFYTIECHLESAGALGACSCLPELTTRTLITDARHYAGKLPVAYSSRANWETEQQVQAKLTNLYGTPLSLPDEPGK